jgi:hypothetical protein
MLAVGLLVTMSAGQGGSLFWKLSGFEHQANHRAELLGLLAQHSCDLILISESRFCMQAKFGERMPLSKPEQ